MKQLHIIALAVALLARDARAAAPSRSAPTNIILILADDLGYAELGCYGQQKLRTPAIDRLARDGMRFTQFYVASAVCAPSRCGLLTGLHMGHAYIRDNREVQPEGQEPLPDTTVTFAQLLQTRGYATAVIGKWGLGPPGSTGDPMRQGFDHFFGYNCQRHAHNYYPTFLWRDHEKVLLEGNTGGATGRQYSPDLMETEALRFIETTRDKSFFLFFASTIPHLALQAPDDWIAKFLGRWPDPPYLGGKGYQPQPHPRAAYAAMVARLDASVERIVALLQRLKLDERTLIVFTSDNGPTYDHLGGSDSDFFASAGPLRGLKGSLYEGGIREPFIAHWPGKIRPHTTSDLPSAAYDLLPTLCDVAGAKLPARTDGISLLPTLLGKGRQQQHEFLYWEFSSYGGQQAVRLGDWKGIRQNLRKGNTRVELYNLATDIGETTNVAIAHPDIVERITSLMQSNHEPSALFPLPTIDAKRSTE